MARTIKTPTFMYLDIDLFDPKPAYVQLVEAVLKAIATGSLQPGDRLPAIRSAAVQARVNRNTVGRAYLELEHLGLVTARQGSGYFVSEAGIEHERKKRLLGINALIEELVDEARLSNTDLDNLIDLIKSRFDETAETAMEEKS